MELTLEPCIPPFWARSGHAQTLIGHVLPSVMLTEKGKRFEIPLPDGDRLVGFHLEGSSNVAVLVFHGLSGDTNSDYMHRTARVCLELGHSVFLVNHRGCGEGAGLAARPYHSGIAEDLSAALDFVKEKLPRHRRFVIGFSLSGNALLLLMTGKRGSTQPDAAIAVNAPIDLGRAAILLKKGLNRIYDIRFVNRLMSEIRSRRRRDPKIPPVTLSRLATLYDFDAAYTARAGGFKDREDYYRSCSTHRLLSEIQRPTVVFTAKDDPFVDYRSYEAAKLSPAVHLHIEKHGGHMGYLSAKATPLGTRRWLDYALREALVSLGAS